LPHQVTRDPAARGRGLIAMRDKRGAAGVRARRFGAPCRKLLWAVVIVLAWSGVFAWPGAAPAQPVRPAAAVLLDRLCAKTMRPNEEDRLFGLISLAVRSTIKYQGGTFDPDLIDDSMQDALVAITAACSQLAATDDAYRLGRAVDLARDATLKRMLDPDTDYSDRRVAEATAADLSEELSAPEIDAWLDGLPPRQRALALLLYAAHLRDEQMADAVGLSPAALAGGFREAKTGLLKFFRADPGAVPVSLDPPAPHRRAMEFSLAGPSLADLLKPQPSPPAPQPAPPAATVRITGISSHFYAGWSLLATVTGLAPGQSLDIPVPILVAPDRPDKRRMIVVAADEVSDLHDTPRRFLLKAYAIDDAREGASLNDSFHLAAATIDNREAQLTLHNRALAAIEVARCLWHDYGTADDPGICR
jgi:DNA-directed RNA polymerase specialized sigma24 family protein